jgi:hypothetical protein
MTDDKTARQLEHLIEKIEALRDEAKGILNGLTGEHPIKSVLAFFDTHWQQQYTRHASPPVPYEFNKAIDPAHVKRLLKTLDETTLKKRIVNYFSDREPFLAKNKHPFNLFVSRINAYATTNAATRPVEQPTIDICAHAPRCTNDAQHTRKRMAELRAPQ